MKYLRLMSFFLLGIMMLSNTQLENIALMDCENLKPCERVAHKYYTVCYNENHEQAAWVSYRLTKQMCETNSVKRKNIFFKDSSITTGSASSDDYKNSGYDRGHLCPAGDMNFSQDAMRESFYMSNVSPQVPAFNRGIWKSLEENVRRWAVADTELFIVTAGVLKDNLSTIGMKNRISVPEYYYKVVLDNYGAEKKAIGFIMPNKKIMGTVFSYAVAVDSVEKITGINFFAALDDSLESLLEKGVDTLEWKY